METWELNEKLARWAGFEKGDWVVEGEWPVTVRGFWRGPDGSVKCGVPDFTTSLDACFKWLVPQLSSYEIATADGQFKGHCAVVFRRPASDMVEADGDTPALALCKAIEKMMEVK